MTMAATIYKGPAGIPHASAELFGAFFLAANVSDEYLGC